MTPTAARGVHKSGEMRKRRDLQRDRVCAPHAPSWFCTCWPYRVRARTLDDGPTSMPNRDSSSSKKPQVDLDQLIAWAVERSDLRAREAAPSLYLLGEEDRVDIRVLLATAFEDAVLTGAALCDTSAGVSPRPPLDYRAARAARARRR